MVPEILQGEISISTQGGFHENYATTPLDQSGHTGTQIVQRYFVNQINKLL